MDTRKPGPGLSWPILTSAVIGVGDAACVTAPVILTEVNERRLTAAAAVRQRRPRTTKYFFIVTVTRSSRLFVYHSL